MQTIGRKGLESKVGEVIGIQISETEVVEGKLNLLAILGRSVGEKTRLEIRQKGKEEFNITPKVDEGFRYSLVNGSIVKIGQEFYKVNLEQ